MFTGFVYICRNNQNDLIKYFTFYGKKMRQLPV